MSALLNLGLFHYTFLKGNEKNSVKIGDVQFILVRI